MGGESKEWAFITGWWCCRKQGLGVGKWEEVLLGGSSSCLCFGVSANETFLPEPYNFLLKRGQCICLHSYTAWGLREAGRVQKHRLFCPQ